MRWSEAALALAAVAAVALAGGAGASALAALVGAAVLWWRGKLPVLLAEDEPEGAPSGATSAAGDASTVALAQALEAGETVVLYRPLRGLPELQLRGVEAELRWRHPLRGLVPPADWPAELPPALANGLLDAWLRPACAQFALWLPGLRARGGASLWLRLPPGLLACEGLADRLAANLGREGLEPSMVVLRVPLRVDGRQARLPDAARELQALGVTIAVDAFGAGSASLTHLHQLPVRTVCLAPSFVARAGANTPQRWVVESTARLAHSMGMNTLAEGISQETQVLALAALGCELGVGDVCGPWLDSADWTRRWSGAPAARAA